MKEKTYLCTRPRLASELIQAGQTATVTVNPWKPERTAWVFPITPELCSIVTAFFVSLGKPIPATIQNERGVD